MHIAYREAFQTLPKNPCPRRRVIPPNRLESTCWDLAAALVQSRFFDPKRRLEMKLSGVLGAKNIYFAPSARSAIAQVLSLLPQKEVVLPAFNCDVVKTAIEAAGKKIIYVDVSPDSVNATSEDFAKAAEPGRILLITYQFGVPTDVESICELAKQRGCVSIEDAACSFAATLRGRHLGTFADVGIFSFESWKRLPAFRGGAVCLNNPALFDPNLLRSQPFRATTSKLPFRELVFAAIRNFATIPGLYGRLVLPKLLRTYSTPEPEPGNGNHAPVTDGAAFTREFHPYQAQLILSMVGRIDKIRDHISALTSIYDDAFKAGPVSPLLPQTRDNGGLLRYPVAIRGRSRASILRQALRRGIYLETEFEQPLPDRRDHAAFPNAVWVGNNAILLPLYRRLSLSDARWLSAQLNEIAALAED